MSGRRVWRRWVGVAGLLALVVQGCGDTPPGPGTFTLAVDASTPLGAVQLEVQGVGITALRGLSSDRVAAIAVGAATVPTWRVVVFEPGGQPIRLAIDVESTDAVLEARVLDVAGTDGAVLSPAGIGVRIER
ncbi:MAG: hypothetical protein RQ745_02105 [Longimicrobiales bacterium]|nr:hypothetical protein [Longimicrobiales bacterium]